MSVRVTIKKLFYLGFVHGVIIGHHRKGNQLINNL